MQPPALVDDELPVLIVGGGGAGLTASMLLARQWPQALLCISLRSRGRVIRRVRGCPLGWPAGHGKDGRGLDLLHR